MCVRWRQRIYSYHSSITLYGWSFRSTLLWVLQHPDVGHHSAGSERLCVLSVYGASFDVTGLQASLRS